MEFWDLECYKHSKKLRVEISKLASALPPKEEYRLKDQMIRSSRSVAANIAEGYGRHHFLDSIRFFTFARASLDELIDHLSVSKDEDYISNEHFNVLFDKCVRSKKLINGYISYLRRRKKQES